MDFSTSYLENLAFSMTKQMEDVIKCKGELTKYKINQQRIYPVKKFDGHCIYANSGLVDNNIRIILKSVQCGQLLYFVSYGQLANRDILGLNFFSRHLLVEMIISNLSLFTSESLMGIL